MKDVKFRVLWVSLSYEKDFKLSTSRETIVEVNNWLKDAASDFKSGGAIYKTMRLGIAMVWKKKSITYDEEQRVQQICWKYREEVHETIAHKKLECST